MPPEKCDLHTEKLMKLEAAHVITDSRIDSMDKYFAEMHKQLAAMQASIDGLTKRLFTDNGAPSFNSRIRAVEQKLDDHHATHGRIDAARSKLIWLLSSTTGGLFCVEVFKWVSGRVHWGPP